MVYYIAQQSEMYLVEDFLKKAKYTTFDLETGPQPQYINTEHEARGPLDPYFGVPILILLGDLGNQFVLDVRADLDLALVGEAVKDPALPKLGANLRFDCKFVMHHWGWWPERLIDTQITEQVLRAGLFTATKEAKVGLVRRMTSMAALVKRYFGEEIDKDKEMRTTFWKTPIGGFDQRQMDYFKGDIEWPIKIAHKQAPIVKERGLQNKLRTEADLIPVLADMELTGIELNVEAWLALYHKACKDVAEYERQLDKLLGIQAATQEDLFGQPQLKRRINYGSSAQLARLLHKRGIKGFVDPKTNKVLSTESKIFIVGKLSGDIPVDIADATVSMRKSEQRRDSYGMNFIKKRHPLTKRVHPDYTQTILVTSRISCSPGLQTIPRDKTYRAAFKARTDFVYSIVDASQIEARIMADLTGDQPALAVFKANGDIYKSDGEAFYNTTIDRETEEGEALRNNAKAAWLGLGYGQGKTKFRFFMMINLNRYVTQEESDELYEKFFEVHWQMKEVMDSWSSMADPELSDEFFEDSMVRYLINVPETYDKLYPVMLNKSRGDKDKAARRTKRILSHPEQVRYTTSYGGGKRMYRCDFFGWYNAARNGPVQGGAAQIQKESMVDLSRFIRGEGINAKLVQTIHDEIVIEVHKSEADVFHEHHKRLMVEAGARYLKQVPMKVSGGLSDVLRKF